MHMAMLMHMPMHVHAGTRRSCSWSMTASTTCDRPRHSAHPMPSSQARAQAHAARAGGGTKDGGTKDGGTKDGETKDGGTKDGGTKDGGTKNGGSGEGGALPILREESGSSQSGPTSPKVRKSRATKVHPAHDDNDGGMSAISWCEYEEVLRERPVAHRQQLKVSHG